MKEKACPLHQRTRCVLGDYCITQKKSYESCADMVSRYNAGLLLPPNHFEKSVFK